MPDRRLLEWARARGYRVAWGPVAVADAAVADVERRREARELDPAFVRDTLAFLREPPSGSRPPIVLVVVVPRPAHLVTFLVGGRRLQAVMPPTYERYRPTFEDVRQDLALNALEGARVETFQTAAKNVASRLGLVRYGRNNITYAPGIGSYLQLCAYLTDAALPVDPAWRGEDPALLEECGRCGVCEAVCPTGAIDGQRVLLHADRCLTLANETEGAWPSWVDPAAHHTLIGCLACQECCPANSELPVIDSGVSFDAAESAALLNEGEHVGEAWEGIRRKLTILGQPYQEPVIGRNLRALLAAR